MRKLSKEQKERIEAARKSVDDARSVANAEREEANDLIRQANVKVGALNEAIREINSAIDDFNALMEDIAGEAQAFFDEKSEKWREGDAGSAYENWIQSLDEDAEEIDTVEDLEEFDEIESSLPDLVEAPE